MTLTLGYLGACDAVWNGKPLAFATNTARALLAYLAVHANQPQTREQLAALFYPDQAQAAALVNLRSTLARVRRALPPECDALDVTARAITFRRDKAQVDAAEFDALLAECTTHAHTHADAAAAARTATDRAACPECVARLRRAAELYRGEFLLGLSMGRSQPFEEWLLLKREQLQHEMLELLSTLTRHAEAQRDYVRMAAHARRAIEIDALHEESHAQLMRALAMSGQRAAALTQFETWSATLQEALGVAPSTELVELRARIDAGDLAALTHAVDPQMRAQTLPAPMTQFFGREDELAGILAQLQTPDPAARLLTLTGLGGMGKTRLAIEAARACISLDGAFDDVHFVSLVALTEPGEVAAAIAAALNLPPSSDNPVSAIQAALRAKRTLLVLDNLEHLLRDAEQRCAGLIVSLLEAAPGLRILATSRERLNMRGERVVEVPGMLLAGETLADLSSAPPVRLFVERARLGQSSFKLTEDNAPAIARICRLVHGMPLGLELAAAWVGTLDIKDIAGEIERSADFLAYDWPDAPVRQRSIRAVFDGSWQLLSEAERQTLQQLSIFRGGFTRSAAEAVARASWQVLARLIRKSLVRQSASGRYDMHELVRQFAQERLYASQTPGDADATRTRHSTWHLGQVAACSPRLARSEPREASAELMADLDNLRQAWAWAVARGDMPLLRKAAYGLYQFYYLRSYLSEGERMFADAIKMCMASGSQTQEGLRLASLCYAIQARFVNTKLQFSHGVTLAERAIELGRQCGEQAGLALGQMRLGTSLNRLGRIADALASFEHAYALARSAHDAPGDDALILEDVEWEAMLWRAHSAFDRSHMLAAQQLCRQALALCEQRGALLGQLRCLLDLIGHALDAVDDEMAEASVRQARALAERLDNPYPLATVFEMQGHVHLSRDEYTLAQTAFERVLTLAKNMSDSRILSAMMATLELGHVFIKLGDYATARHWLRRFEQADNSTQFLQYGLMWELHMARLALHTGETANAQAHARNALQMARKRGSTIDEAKSLQLLGHALETHASHSEAVQCYEQAHALAQQQPRAHSVVEPLAGLARIALARGEAGQALVLVEDIMTFLVGAPCTGLENPYQVYQTCICVLHAVNDARAETMQRLARARLERERARIGDAELRRSYLNAVSRYIELEQAAG